MQVQRRVDAAKAAAQKWRHSTFRQRRLLMRTILQYILEHQDAICRCGNPCILTQSGCPVTSMEAASQAETLSITEAEPMSAVGAGHLAWENDLCAIYL